MSLLRQLCCSTSSNSCIDAGLKISVLVICCDSITGINVARNRNVHQSTNLITDFLYLEGHSDISTTGMADNDHMHSDNRTPAGPQKMRPLLMCLISHKQFGELVHCESYSLKIAVMLKFHNYVQMI